jgi:formylglycine-generating enzyme required for sulfatase activity
MQPPPSQVPPGGEVPPGEDDRRVDPEISRPKAAPPVANPSIEVVRRLGTHAAKTPRYVERGELARGGMGVVLKVWDEDLRRQVAKKMVLGRGDRAVRALDADPKTLGRFLEEAQVTAQLEHPGIVPVHELGLDAEGRAYFTMQLVRGRNLLQIFDLVRAGKEGWTPTRALMVMLKVCEAMAYAHSKGVIHRDLKPENVMVGHFGEVYVMDWGLARVQGREDLHDLRIQRDPSTHAPVESERRASSRGLFDSSLYTMDGDVVGTPVYMSPEQARGQVERLDPRSDVYSVGAMLYFLLGGEMPYVPPGSTSVDAHAVLRWLLEGPPRPLHELDPRMPPELVAVCEKAMARDPDRRYADMSALADDLRAYLEGRVVHAYEGGALAEFKKWVARNRATARATAAALLVFLGGLGTVAYVQARGRAAERRLRRDAEQSATEARRQEAIARSEQAKVLRLSAFQILEDLQHEAESLWPAEPALVPAYEDWLARAAELVQGLQGNAERGEPGHYQTLAELRARALPEAPEERERARREHPRYAELAALERERDARKRAADVRAGRAAPAGFVLDAALPERSPAEWNEAAWQLVDPDRSEFGREAEGLALARRALERVPPEAPEAPEEWAAVADTLAWACFANGLDDEALSTAQAAVESLLPEGRTGAEARLARLEEAIEAERAPGGSPALVELEPRIADLEREVSARSVWRFADADDAWWHNQLAKLVHEIEEFASPERGLVSGLSERFGSGIARRLEFASALSERSLTGAEAAALWASATASIADEGECPAYGGLVLEPVLGLLPLGRDPGSGLWEFAHLASGEPAARGTSGELVLGERTGIVLVLLPGGTFDMGAQRQDTSGENFDPMAEPTEGPVHSITLAPFFLSKHELTQGQWLALSGRNPSSYFPGGSERAVGPTNPVEQVSWNECTALLPRLGLELPTEAQWEYAARAGSSTPWWTGDEKEGLEGAANLADAYAHGRGATWRPYEDWLDDGAFVHAPAGSYEPNPFGLHDVVGNVWEWCGDLFAEYRQPVRDGDGARAGGGSVLRVVRGGSFNTSAANGRSSGRQSATPELRAISIGLRPARALESATQGPAGR